MKKITSVEKKGTRDSVLAGRCRNCTFDPQNMTQQPSTGNARAWLEGEVAAVVTTRTATHWFTVQTPAATSEGPPPARIYGKPFPNGEITAAAGPT